ncbi:MAG: HupE/UreJ family protein [Methylotenera sp.]|nr:HupE/UreJ family protein [Methylotenera sp.]
MMTNYKWIVKTALSVLTLSFLPTLAHAHIGVGVASGWMHGVLHPFLGLDHLCAMLAVGIWARQMGGRALWAIPLTFVGLMALGGLLGMSEMSLPFIEGGIFFSLIALGFLVAVAIQLPLSVSATIVGVFALFHGYAHVTEMPTSASGLSYALGFMLSTALLHVSGIVMASGLTKIGRLQWLRLIGACIAVFGGTLYFVA